MTSAAERNEIGEIVKPKRREMQAYRAERHAGRVLWVENLLGPNE